MLTLRIGPRRERSSQRRADGFPAHVSPQPGDPPAPTEVCPRCQQGLTEYRFATDGGLSIITYHCVEHGDVIPRAASSCMIHNEEEKPWK